MTRNEPTNGRKKPQHAGHQLTLWQGMAPVTAYDLAVWVFGVSHVDLQTRNLAQHIKDWDYLNKIAGYKAHCWPEWLDIEAKAIVRAGHWSGGHGQAALFLAADALRPTLARAIALGARFS